MRIASLDGATALSHEGVDYEAGPDGMFDLPHEVGQALIAFPHWVQEYQLVDQRNAEQAAADTDPALLAARVEALEAAHEDLHARLGALEAGRSKAPAKKAPAKVAEPKPNAGD